MSTIATKTDFINFFVHQGYEKELIEQSAILTFFSKHQKEILDDEFLSAASPAIGSPHNIKMGTLYRINIDATLDSIQTSLKTFKENLRNSGALSDKAPLLSKDISFIVISRNGIQYAIPILSALVMQLDHRGHIIIRFRTSGLPLVLNIEINECQGIYYAMCSSLNWLLVFTKTKYERYQQLRNETSFSKLDTLL